MELTDEQIEKIRQDSIHERLVVGSDIRKLISELRSNKALVKEMYKYRHEAINERVLSESIVAEREELYQQVEKMEEALKWYAEMRAFPANYDTGECARITLQTLNKGAMKNGEKNSN